MLKIINTQNQYRYYKPYNKSDFNSQISFGRTVPAVSNKKNNIETFIKIKSLLNDTRKFFNNLTTGKLSIFSERKNYALNTRHGTILDGAKPLPDFWKEFGEVEKKQLLKSGFSTNTVGDAYALLKSKAQKPLSTSFVQNCSVIYLYNKETQTHFLYHLYPEMPIYELGEVFEKFFSEGYTKACIIPGYEYFKKEHKKYLPAVIKFLKSKMPNSSVKTFYSKTPHPEIVGYKGDVYEIENSEFLKKRQLGQASFKISNILSYEIFYDLKHCKSLNDIKKLKQMYIKANYDKTVYKVLDNLLKERANDFL